ncbi:MAG: FAD-dependent oxidoreductase [Myxococcota bacterium]|nr:FAD-dependent oxidoreductase [Myxococcota bacterium]
MNISATVCLIQPLTEHVFELYLQPEREIQYQPGQWVSIKIPIESRRPMKRVYSMAGPMRSDGKIHLVFDVVPGGIGTGYLSSLQPDDRVEIVNSMGNFVLDELRPKNLVFFARYTGLIPILAMLKALEAEKYRGRVSLYYSSPCASEVLFRETLTGLDLDMHCEFILLDEHSSDLPELSTLTQVLSDASSDSTQVYICGVGQMVKPLRKHVLDLGWPRGTWKTERYN